MPAADDRADESRLGCRRKIHHAKRGFQIVGGVVCILFALQGVIILVEGPAETTGVKVTFWSAAHWLAEALLCIGVGIVTLALELRQCFAQVRRHVGKIAGNRIGIALLYAWLGAYSADGRFASAGEGWRLLGHVTGLVAWGVAIGHLVLSCCITKYDMVDDPEKDDKVDLEGGGPSPATIGASPPQLAGGAHTGGDNPFGSDDGGDNPFGADSGAQQSEPQQQWNDVGAKPFGAS